jgi:transcriptional regulator with XRE-family HTH domain
MDGFRRRLKVRREELGLSTHDLARRIGKGASFIAALESGTRGKTLPSYNVLHRIAENLTVDPDWLAYGQGDPPTGPPPRALIEFGPSDDRHALPLQAIIDFVEAWPDPTEQAQFQHWRAELPRADYERLLVGIFTTWAASFALFKDTLRGHRSPDHRT